jgi:general stress protein YciG
VLLVIKYRTEERAARCVHFAVWPLQNARVMQETEKKHHEATEGETGEGSHKGGRARGTAAMDPETRHEVARKGGLAVSRNKQHMAEIGRKGGQTVSKNREHMARIGRKGGEASRRSRAETPAAAAAMGAEAGKPALTKKPSGETGGGA